MKAIQFKITVVRLPALFAFFILATISPQISAQQDQKDFEASAKSFLRSWQEAFNNNDAKKHLQLYSRQGNLKVILAKGGKPLDYKQLVQEYEEAYDHVEFLNSKLKFESLSATKNIAWAVAIHETDFRDKESKRKFHLHVRTSFVLKKVRDRWRIVLEHSSPVENVPRVKEIR